MEGGANAYPRIVAHSMNEQREIGTFLFGCSSLALCAGAQWSKCANGKGNSMDEHTIFFSFSLFLFVHFQVDYLVKCACSPRAYQKSSNWYLFGAGVGGGAAIALRWLLEKNNWFFLTRSVSLACSLALPFSFVRSVRHAVIFAFASFVQCSHLCQRPPYNGICMTLCVDCGAYALCYHDFVDGGG